MRNAMMVRALLAATILCAATAAHAQGTEKIFVNINFGQQLATRSLSSTASTPIYEEIATLVSAQTVNEAPVIDVGAGYLVRNAFLGGKLFGALTLTRFSDTEEGDTTASIPNPVFFNRPRIVTGTATDLKRTELGAALHATYVRPLMGKLSLAGSGGFIFIQVKQDLVGGFNIVPGTQNFTSSVTTDKAQGMGPFAELQVIFNLNSMFGIDGYARYAGAKVDLNDSLLAHNVGGMQAGGGFRVNLWK